MGDVTAVGGEGGLAPNKLTSEFEPAKDFMIAMDAASSEWKSEKGKGFYKQPNG